jgi:glucuronate isomerase
MTFIHEDFLLENETARRLYRQYAADQPILDYHCHLSPQDVAANRRFRDLFEIWLEGDHYKWRAMRANGISERYCTGDASHYDKFLAWASTVPRTLRNPLYHWTHLELSRYFGIDELLDEKTAPAIWKRANELLATDELSAHGILKKFAVQALCTTDDPTDDLKAHASIAASSLPTRVYPAFRPDSALDAHSPETFNPWVERLAAVSNTDISSFTNFLDALRKRHDAFHKLGSRLSDHGLDHCYANFCDERKASEIFDQARAGRAITPEEHEKFASYMMLFFGRLDSEKGWTKQLHLGALRNVSTRGFKAVGPNTGFDSIGQWPQAEALAAYLDRLDQERALPKIILYNNNPVDNYAFATMVGNFQDGSIPGKLQFGSGWWYLDQREAMEWQLNALSNTGLLSRFVGMLTDSRSFMSYPRHEYFRRVLCNLLGREVESGELPDREDLLGPMIENICFNNARQYLGLELPTPQLREKTAQPS